MHALVKAYMSISIRQALLNHLHRGWAVADMRGTRCMAHTECREKSVDQQDDSSIMKIAMITLVLQTTGVSDSVSHSVSWSFNSGAEILRSGNVAEAMTCCPARWCTCS